jgi:outer membrane protein OmpA-like peptidoglycan-associated protein
MFTLRTESRIELNLFAEYLKKNTSIKIELGGHTDSRGNETVNIELSQNRAATVYRYLIDKGVSSDRMTYKGYGSSNPIFSDQQINNMKTTLEKKEAHQKNRRTVWRETL